MLSRPGEAVYVNVAAGRYPMSGFINLDNSPFLRIKQPRFCNCRDEQAGNLDFMFR